MLFLFTQANLNSFYWIAQIFFQDKMFWPNHFFEYHTRYDRVLIANKVKGDAISASELSLNTEFHRL
jgi:hypothetical protein